MSSHEAVLHRVGDVTPPTYMPAGRTTAFISCTVNGGTVVLEHLTNEPATGESPAWVLDATYSTNQSRTSFAGTVGFIYRLRCTVAPTASLDLLARLEFNG